MPRRPIQEPEQLGLFGESCPTANPGSGEPSSKTNPGFAAPGSPDQKRLNADEAIVALQRANLETAGVRIEAMAWQGWGGILCCGLCVAKLDGAVSQVMRGPYRVVWGGGGPGMDHVIGRCLRCSERVEGHRA